MYLLFHVVTWNTCFAQSSPAVFINYTTANGLPDPSVQSLLQDSRGYLWAGTREGLSRFDGTVFRNFFSSSADSIALPGNSISNLNENRQGELLFLADGKLTVMNTLTKQFRLHPFSRQRIFYRLNRLDENRFVLSAIDSCFIMNEKLNITDTLVPPHLQKNTTVVASYISPHRILIGNQHEYFFYDTGTRTYSSFLGARHLPQRLPLLNFQYFDPVSGIFYFSNFFEGILGFNENGSLRSAWKQDGSSSGLNNANISFIEKENDSTLIIGTLGGGLHLLNLRNKLFTKIFHTESDQASIMSNAVTAYYRTRDQTSWFATDKGLSKLKKTEPGIQHWTQLLQTFNTKQNTYPIAISKGKDGLIYAGLYNEKTYFRFSPDGGLVKPFSSSKLPPLWQLNNIDGDIVFTGAGTSIAILDPFKNNIQQSDFLAEYYPQSEIVVMAFRTNAGDRWFSANNGGGFVRINALNGKISHYLKDGPAGHFSMSYYTSKAETSDGDLWFGVNKNNQLLKWDHKTDHFSEIFPGEIPGLAGKTFAGITDLLLCDNKLWIAFDGTGIVCFDIAANKGKHYTMETGLPGNYVNLLIADHKNRIWAGTTKGLACLDLSTGKTTSFTKDDGLPDDNFLEHCAYFDSSTHKLWLGSARSIMQIDTDSLLRYYSKDLPLFIDDILINGKTCTGSRMEENRFSAEETNIEFHFGIAGLFSPRDIEFSYRLTGADKKWTSSSSSGTATYSNLAPGHYIFEVRARHKGDTAWTILQQPFKFHIATPWFATWWFRGLVIIVLALLATWIIRQFYQRKLEKQKAILENEKAIESERTRMARELHDGLGSMLSGIKHSFSALQQELPLSINQQAKFDNNIHKLNETIRELRSITHSLAADSLLKYGLENTLRDYCNNLSHGGGLHVTFTSVGAFQSPLSGEKAFHTFRIVQELLQNITKHADASEVLVQLSIQEHWIQLTVEDNGKGFDVKAVGENNGIGLINIRMRLEQIKGKVDFKSEPGRGTSVYVEIPLKD